MNFPPEIFGYIAGFLTTICFFPQVVTALRSNNTESTSLLMYILFSTGVACWLAYGVLLHNWPMMIANSITLPLSLIVLFKKIQNLRKGIDSK